MSALRDLVHVGASISNCDRVFNNAGAQEQLARFGAQIMDIPNPPVPLDWLLADRLDISHVFDALGARRQVNPHSPELVLPRYRAALAGNIVDITMTFVTGSHYCCVEWGCHLPLHDKDMWRWLRRALTAIAAAPEEPMRARVTITVECGALFFDVSRPDPAQRGRYAFAPMQTWGYECWVDEGDPHGPRT